VWNILTYFGGTMETSEINISGLEGGDGAGGGNPSLRPSFYIL
jgi:hypothetical protein